MSLSNRSTHYCTPVHGIPSYMQPAIQKAVFSLKAYLGYGQLFLLLVSIVHQVYLQREHVGEQRISLVCQVCKGVIYFHILDVKASSETWLIYPDLSLIKGIAICKGALKIVNACPYKEHIMNI